MAIVQCGNNRCNMEYNKALPNCPYCGCSTEMAIIIDERAFIPDGTGSEYFKIIHRIDNPLGHDITIFRKDYNTYGVAQSIQDIILPRTQYIKYSYIDNEVTETFLRVNVAKDGMIKWGIIDINGEVVIPIEYDNIWKLRSSYIHRTRIEKNGHYYIVDLEKNANNGEKLIIKSGLIKSPKSLQDNSSNFIDEVCNVFNSPNYNDALDIDQQSPEFWNSL